MAAQTNQDFVTFAGDDVFPIFTVYNASGVVVDISTATEITWAAYSDSASAAVATKTKTGGTITFVTDGTDGKFQVTIDKTTTAALSGYYLHKATLTDNLGNITTVEVGRMQVGAKPAWTYNPAQISTSQLFQVRRLLGDVIQDDAQMWDDEILFFISLRANVYGATAEAARALAAQYSRKVDVTSPGEIRTAYSTQATAYQKLAVLMEQRSKLSGAGGAGYAGGISVSDKKVATLNTDRVQPSFNLGMTDNLFMPVAPVGNEVPIKSNTVAIITQ